MSDIILPDTTDMLPDGYEAWRKAIESRIEMAKLHAILKVNSDLLSLYWSIGNDILEKQQKLGWGAQVIDRLSSDLSRKFPDDRGFSVRNLKYMRMFAEAYPDFPFVQVFTCTITGIPNLASSACQIARRRERLCASTACTNHMVSPHLAYPQSEELGRKSIVHYGNGS